MIIAVLLLGSCKTTPEPPVTAVEFKIQYSPETLTLEAQEGSKSVIVTSNANWTVSSDQTWCTLSPFSGYSGDTSLKIEVSANQTDKDRTAVLTFKSENASKKYTVTQKA